MNEEKKAPMMASGGIDGSSIEVVWCSQVVRRFRL